jgi:hypothetical protein
MLLQPALMQFEMISAIILVLLVYHLLAHF